MQAWIDAHILTLLIFAPLAGGLALLFIPKKYSRLIRGWALGTTLATFGASLHLVVHFLPRQTAYQFLEKFSWNSALGLHYAVGIDGISLWLVLLTTLLMPLAVLFSMGSIRQQEKSYYFLLLSLQCGMLGAFCALDAFCFYVFWEAMLIPMYFLIGIYGGSRRVYASLKFFLFTLVGSVLMLLAMMFMYARSGHSFLLQDWTQLLFKPETQLILFAAFALSFAIKVPMFPLHSWLPDAHVEAPTAGSVILAGVLLKMGTYGFIRFAIPLFPAAVEIARPWLVALSVVGIVYGALVAMVQTDIKKLIAYSSISHLGFIMLGLMASTTQATVGAVYQMLNHGISTGALFLLVGMLYDRTHTRQIADYGGVAKQLPLYTFCFMIVAFSSIALPATNGFVGEFLILSGSFPTLKTATIVAASGVVLSAVYMLWMTERVFFGPCKNPALAGLKDLNLREFCCLLPLLACIVWMGVRPQFFLNKIEPSVAAMKHRLDGWGHDRAKDGLPR